MALRLGKLFRNGPALWLRMQQDYDLTKATAASLVGELARIEPVAALRWIAAAHKARHSGILSGRYPESTRRGYSPIYSTAFRVDKVTVIEG